MILLSADDVSHPKPYPEIYWKIMTHLNAIPANTVIVEDSPIGRQAAKHSVSNEVKTKRSDNLFFKKL